MKIWGTIFPDISQILTEIPAISLRAVKFVNKSPFSLLAVTLCVVLFCEINSMLQQTTSTFTTNANEIVIYH